jgi:hypothetical protein
MDGFRIRRVGEFGRLVDAAEQLRLCARQTRTKLVEETHERSDLRISRNRTLNPE